MKPKHPTRPALVLGLLAAAAFHLTARAATPFDADIKNNSLAVSPDERLAAVCYSDADRAVIYDLAAGKPLKTLTGFVTPRNIVFTPDGKSAYVLNWDLSLAVVDTAARRIVRTLTPGNPAPAQP